jgi:putative oxidoreductase
MTTLASRTFTRDDLGLLLLRGVVAAPFFFHGSQKLFGWFGGGGLVEFATYLDGLHVPASLVAAWLAALSELVGAAILVSGRGFLALVPLIFTMAVATAASARNGFDVLRGGAEYPLMLGVVLVFLVLRGPGALVVSIPPRHSR